MLTIHCSILVTTINYMYINALVQNTEINYYKIACSGIAKHIQGHLLHI